MSDYLSKEKSLFLRDERGELLSVEVPLEFLDGEPKIKILPMTKGELNKYLNEKTENREEEIILKFCKDPQYTPEDIRYLKPKIVNAIVFAVLAFSLDIDQKDLQDQMSKSVEGSDFLFKKKKKKNEE